MSNGMPPVRTCKDRSNKRKRDEGRESRRSSKANNTKGDSEMGSFRTFRHSTHSRSASSSSSSSYHSSSFDTSETCSNSSSSVSDKHYPMFDTQYVERFKYDRDPFIYAVSSSATSLTEGGGSLFPMTLPSLVTLDNVSTERVVKQGPRLVLYDKYLFIRVLGEGTFSKVVLCSALDTGELYALKIFRDESTYRRACLDELRVLMALCRPCVDESGGKRYKRSDNGKGHRNESAHRRSRGSKRPSLTSDLRRLNACAANAYQGKLGRFNPPVDLIRHRNHHAIVLPLLGMSLLDVLSSIRQRVKHAIEKGNEEGRCEDELNEISTGNEYKSATLEKLYELPQKPVKVVYKGMPLELVRSVVYNVLLFLRHAHQRGIVHTDLKPENVLFEYDNTLTTRLEIKKREYKYLTPLVAGEPLNEMGNEAQPTVQEQTIAVVDVELPAVNSVRVVDVGSAEFLSKCNYISLLDGATPVFCHRIHTTHYRSVEVLLGLGWTSSADMWSLGCMIPELLTGSCMFMPRDDREHLALLEHIIGPFDTVEGGEANEVGATECEGGMKADDQTRDWEKTIVGRVFSKGRRFGRFFNEKTMQLEWHGTSDCSPPPSSASSSECRSYRHMMEDIYYVASRPKLREVLRPFPLLLDLCLRMLDYDPLRRITAEEALEHPFFTSPIECGKRECTG